MVARSVSASKLVAAVALAVAVPVVAFADDGAPIRKPASASSKGADGRATTVLEAWRALPRMQGQGCGEDLIFDYGAEGGMRNLFCRGLTVFSWKTFVQLAPSPIFASGPHKGARLDLHAKKDFGHYSPAFVQWATESLIPGANDAAFRAETQGIYNAELKNLAHTYWQVRVAIESEPGWIDAEKKAYVVAVGKGAVDDSFWDYSDLLGNGDENWGGYDPSLVRSATMWWLRRELDGTAAQWKVGLRRLLNAYDGDWLAHGVTTTKGRPLPRTAPPAKPEYR